MSILKNENIICISWLVWDSIPLVMHQMMTRLAEHNRVLFVDPPVAYSNLAIKPSLLKNHFQKTLLWLRGVRKVKDNLHVFYPPPLVMQYGHVNFADKFNQDLTARAIRKAADSLGFKNPILWIYHPYAIRPDGQFNEKLVCYDCNDDVGFFYCAHFNKRKKLAIMEEELTKNADIVFATSGNLFNLRRKQNPRTYFFPSGIDFDHFRKALSPSLPVANDMRNIPKPIIGFVGGMVNAKMNWSWIESASNAKVDWSFVFIGPCAEKPPGDITRKKNIYFLGTRDMECLPQYLKAFDVCIIPYQGEEFLKNCFPTKVFEYLAAGKPVVSVSIPALEEYSKVISLTRNVEEFISNIENALKKGKDDAAVKSYIETAGGETWDNRVKGVSEAITLLLKQKRHADSANQEIP